VADLSRVGAIILAAGSSHRLGRPKQLLDLEGKPVLQHVLDAVDAAGVGEIVVVLGHAADRIEAALTLPEHARVVVNSDHATGQGSSLRIGLDRLSPHVGRAVMLLGDQPRVASEAIRAVAAGAGPIIRAVYRGTPGHPVAFDRDVWAELAATATGDQGGRELLRRDPQRVHDVALDHPSPLDIDTDDDYMRVLRGGR
jgi:molybdenum cofactor cytidylyltransferase